MFCLIEFSELTLRRKFYKILLNCENNNFRNKHFDSLIIKQDYFGIYIYICVYIYCLNLFVGVKYVHGIIYFFKSMYFSRLIVFLVLF